MEFYSEEVTWELNRSTSTGAAHFTVIEGFIVISPITSCTTIRREFFITWLKIFFISNCAVWPPIFTRVVEVVSVFTITSWCVSGGTGTVPGIWAGGIGTVPGIWGSMGIFGWNPYEASISKRNHAIWFSTDTCQSMFVIAWVCEYDVGDVIFSKSIVNISFV